MMSRPREIALRIIHGLDAARRVSSRESPVDEVGLIEAAIADALDEAQMQISLRDEEIAVLKAVYHPIGKRAVTEAKRAEVKRLLADGTLSYREIAAAIGYKSPSLVHRIAKGPRP